MSTVNYSLRVEETDKQKAEEVFRTLGMSFSTGINIYLKAVGRQQRIPFDLAVNKQQAVAPVAKNSRNEKEKSFNALHGILAGYEIDLNKEREERISS